MWWFLMRFYVMLCMILMVCICYCCFDNFQMLNFLSTTIFYYNPKISFFMMNLVWEYPNIKIHSKVCQINRLEIALTNHVLHLGYTYTAKTKPMIGRTFYGHAQFMYKYKNWAKRRYGIYLADSGKLFYRGIALRRETDEYHLP